MKHYCTRDTDLDELIGRDESDGFHQGPMYVAIKRNEPLELEKSGLLSPTVFVKIARFGHSLLVPETGENLNFPDRFQIVFH